MPVKRVGMVIGLHADRLEAYRQLHAHSQPGVRDLLSKYHLRNFSIFLQEIGGFWYEFGYYEYVGADYASDMAAMNREPRTIEWLKQCDPMQQPLPGSAGWTPMEQIFFNA